MRREDNDSNIVLFGILNQFQVMCVAVMTIS